MSIKPRKRDTCKKTECVRYESYKKWHCGDSNLNHCMECKWASVSQYKAKEK